MVAHAIEACPSEEDIELKESEEAAAKARKKKEEAQAKAMAQQFPSHAPALMDGDLHSATGYESQQAQFVSTPSFRLRIDFFLYVVGMMKID